MSTTQFESIYYNQSRLPGRVRITDGGLGWKASDKGQGGSVAKVSEPVLVPAQEIQACHWSRAAKGYELRVQTKNRGVMRLDGFETDDFNSLKNALKNDLSMTLEVKEHSMRGWNWGKVDLERSELVFNIANKPTFEIPYTDVSNSNLVNKSEVAVEFNLQQGSERVRAGDELVEMRFYMPGTITKEVDDDTKEKKEGSGSDDEEEEVEEESVASVFYEQLKDRADIGAVAGDAIASFGDIYFLTPRGRYDIDMYASSFRLRGKSYDYKLQYSTVHRIFVVPKPDGLHHLIVLQVDPPLRQGQTRYPFLVIQFKREEVLEIELNLEDDQFESTYKGKLEKKYDEAANLVVANLFRGLTGKKAIFPSGFVSTQGEAGFSCSNKANEGYLYPLEKGFLFTPKPTIYLPFSDIQHVTFSRLDTSVQNRTFDITIKIRGSALQHQFSNIEREQQSGLETFMKSKLITIRDDGAEREKLARQLAAAESSDEEMGEADRGSAGEDEESEDEDFGSDDASDSDVAEEFDEDHQTDSEATDDEGAGGAQSADEEEASRVKKKAKN